jgi:hypothetical protein
VRWRLRRERTLGHIALVLHARDVVVRPVAVAFDAQSLHGTPSTIANAVKARQTALARLLHAAVGAGNLVGLVEYSALVLELVVVSDTDTFTLASIRVGVGRIDRIQRGFRLIDWYTRTKGTP